MINNKTDLSKISKTIHKTITKNGHNIKLANVRERIADSLNFNSVNDLLSQLPTELTYNFWLKFPKLLESKHRIEMPITPWTIPFPADYPLTPSEKESIWKCFRKWHRCENDLELTIDGNEVRADGEGGWLFSGTIPYSLEEFPEIKAEEDTEIQHVGDELTLFEIHLKVASTHHDGCDMWHSEQNYEDNLTLLSELSAHQNITPEKIPPALRRIENEYPLKGFDLELNYDDIFEYDYENQDKFFSLLTEQGIVFKSDIFGCESHFASLGYYQLFFLAKPENVPKIPLNTAIGNYFVTKFEPTTTVMSESLFNKYKGILLDPASKDTAIEYQAERQLDKLCEGIRTDIEANALSAESMIHQCTKDKNFPLTSIIGEVDEFDEIELGISISEDNGVFTINCMPLINIITQGHENTDEFLGVITTLYSEIKKANKKPRIIANDGEIYSDNITEDIALSVIYQKGMKLKSDKSPFGKYTGNLNPEFAANWFKKLGVIHFSANAFNSASTADWIHLSIAGFNSNNERISVFSISFYTKIVDSKWDVWLESFQKTFGKNIHINETFEYTWHYEDNPRNDFVPPYNIPKAPCSVRKEIGLAALVFWEANLNGPAPLTLPQNFNSLLLTCNDWRTAPTFRITPMIDVPNGEEPFEFMKEAISFAGDVELSDDKSWANFMKKVFEFIVINMTPTSQIYSFILSEGGDKGIQHIGTEYIPNTFDIDWQNRIMGHAKESKFNTIYDDASLLKMQEILNIKGAKGINFFLNGSLP